jgi:uncharacterized protein Smg (DUF494 family)
MTKLQKRIYLLILKSLLLLLFYKFHSPDQDLREDHDHLRQELHEAIMDLADQRKAETPA